MTSEEDIVRAFMPCPGQHADDELLEQWVEPGLFKWALEQRDAARREAERCRRRLKAAEQKLEMYERYGSVALRRG